MVAIMTQAAVVYSKEYWCDIGAHVFPMEKYRRVFERLVAEDGVDEDSVLAPEPCSREQLLLVHSSEYLRDLTELRWSSRTMMSELPLAADIVRAYILAAGGTVLAARHALSRGFAVSIGGGFHHAFADRAEGFCYINDLAVATRVMRADHGVERVAIVDLDVHQGNGTARIFEDDANTFTLSIHQEANYPIPKQRSDLDVGLPDGTGDEAYLAALQAALERVWAFGPQLVLYQAGADPYREDKLGGLALTIEGLSGRDHAVLGGCATRRIPVVVTLGGGYAQEVEDTVTIHHATCRMAIQLAKGEPGLHH